VSHVASESQVQKIAMYSTQKSTILNVWGDQSFMVQYYVCVIIKSRILILFYFNFRSRVPNLQLQGHWHFKSC